jgi:hypothetical protein
MRKSGKLCLPVTLVVLQIIERPSVPVLPIFCHKNALHFVVLNHCIGYLGHPLEKEALWAFMPASFFLSGGTQSSIEVGSGSRSQEKTRVYGQKTIREGMQWLHERSA